MITVGRAITHKCVAEAPVEFLALANAYRGLCDAIEYRGVREGDDETVQAAMAAVPELVLVIDRECVAYITALAEKINTLEKELERFR